nr:hypothetical protein [Tanacetum cinerariifolium]
GNSLRLQPWQTYTMSLIARLSEPHVQCRTYELRTTFYHYSTVDVRGNESISLEL